MGNTYSTTLKNARMQLVPDMIDGLTPAASTGTPSAGKLVILTSAGVVLATFTLPVPSMLVSGGVATLQGVPLTVPASATGTAAKASFRTGADTNVDTNLTVGTSGTNIVLASTAITAGQPVVITAGTITHG